MSDQLPPSRFGAGHTYGGSPTGRPPAGQPVSPTAPTQYGQVPWGPGAPPPSYGQPAPSYNQPGTPRSTTSAATAVLTILLALAMAVDQGIAAFYSKDAIQYLGELPPQALIDVVLPFGLTVLLGLGALLLMCRLSFGRFLVIVGGLGLVGSYGSMLLSAYGDVGPGYGSSGYGVLLLQRPSLSTLTAADLDSLATATTVLLIVMTVAGLLTTFFALLPATGRWCRRQ